MKKIGMVLILLLLAGCGYGSDDGGTPDGEAYGSLTWTEDITGADFSEIGIPVPVTKNQIYKLKIGDHTVFWQSILFYNFYSRVTIEGGTPGKDRIYTAEISWFNITWNESLVASNVDVVQPSDTSPPQELRDFNGEEFEEGILGEQEATR